jgi:diguanylate cyclase
MKSSNYPNHIIEHSVDSFEGLIADEWNSIIDDTPPFIIKSVAELIDLQFDDLLSKYKHYIATDPILGELITTDDMRKDLAVLFECWVRQLFGMQFSDVNHFIHEQNEIGKKLSRIGYPPHAVSKSLRIINSWVLFHTLHKNLSEQEKIDSVTYISNLIGLSYEIRNHGYMKNISHQTRLDESYRLAATGNNMAMERERQRAFLTEWERNILAWFYNPSEVGLPRLAKSEFGMWFTHKANIMFEMDPTLKNVSICVNKIDHEILPRLETIPYDDRTVIGALFNQIENDLVKIKFVMNEIFDSHIELDNAKDMLTKLLSRRFMHTVLSREIALQKRVDSVGFAILILDLDHFKNVNDSYGHAAGDMVLQKIAALITNSVKPSDFVFRYGGEEILIVLVEVVPTVLNEIAESIRRRVEQTPFQIPNGSSIQLTVSIGGALAKGKFDYELVITQADQALYQAKNSGRNKSIISN